LLVD
jgi:hypothetical protein